jgi:TPR repeat protein
MLALGIATPASADAESAYNAGVAAFEAGDFAKAYSAWLPLAHSGEVDAQRNIGLLHQTGRGVALDLGAAF